MFDYGHYLAGVDHEGKVMRGGSEMMKAVMLMMDSGSWVERSDWKSDGREVEAWQCLNLCVELLIWFI